MWLKNVKFHHSQRKLTKLVENYQNEEFKFLELFRKLSVICLCLTLLTWNSDRLLKPKWYWPSENFCLIIRANDVKVCLYLHSLVNSNIYHFEPLKATAAPSFQWNLTFNALQISIGWLSVISSVIPLALKGFYL